MGDKCGCCLCFSIFKVTLVEHCIKENMPSRAENKVNNITASTTGVNVPCFLCQKPSTEQCTQCKLVYFCSKEHYHLHRITLRQEVSTYLVTQHVRRAGSMYFRVASPRRASLTLQSATLEYIEPGDLILFSSKTV